MIIGGKNFDTANHTYIMGILNVTPDSFSDGGKFLYFFRASGLFFCRRIKLQRFFISFWHKDV